jgi:hypothetical protein
MTVWNPITALGGLFRRRPAPPPDVLEAYAHEVIPVLDRAEWLYQYWLEQASLFSDGEKLGNVAAIHRWETATMERSLERVEPPDALAGAHDRVLDALEMASRAAQMLSSGSRFHNANALCEGWSLLDASRERRLSALRSMRRYLVPRTTPAPEPEPEPEPVEASVATPPGEGGEAPPPQAGEGESSPVVPSGPPVILSEAKDLPPNQD